MRGDDGMRLWPSVAGVGLAYLGIKLQYFAVRRILRP
jgi:hypothetical protein